MGHLTKTERHRIEQLPAAEIQRRLNQTGIVVSLSTITRFIKVRER